MSKELRDALDLHQRTMRAAAVASPAQMILGKRIGAIDAILRYAECNPTIPDRALCQCWCDVIQAAIPAALWDRVSKETA